VSTAAVPNFFLYGEAPRADIARFLHLEALDDRSRPSEWTIRPHAHTSLNHLFFIIQGAGEVRIEDKASPFKAPAVFVIPAGVIHAFAFEAESAGSVLTISGPYLAEVAGRDPALTAVFARPAVLDAGEESESVAQFLRQLGRELTWAAPAHEAAVEACLLGLLVASLRLIARSTPQDRPTAGRQAELTARFRGLIEQRYREHPPLEAYARDLGVSVSQLRTACLKSAAAPPLRLIQERLMLEARRLLIYTSLTVAQVAYSLGYDDPAHFSRGFAQHAGCSPRAFRRREAERTTSL
jgi:AraC family transcriptional activator of pobA